MNNRTLAHPAPTRSFRRLVLGTALLLALTVWLMPRSPVAFAQDAKPAASAPTVATPAPPAPPPAPGKAATKDAKPKSSVSAKIDVSTDKAGNSTVTIEKSGSGPSTDAEVDAEDDSGPVIGIGPGKHGKKRVRVGVFGDEHEYDSFGEFAHTEPGLAFMVVAIVAVVFLSPVLAIALILWYRMRKAKMLNETMLRLAEKGVVPPADALGALAGGNPAAALSAGPATAPLYEQAKQIRRRAAWSDLRKGVILAGFGLGLTFFSIFDDGTPNSVGLVLLFVGVGYLVLWWFEERQLAPAGTAAGSAPPVGPPAGTNGSA
jgi:hypothetical protein